MRWYGPQRVEGFLDSLVRIVKDEDSEALAAYANFPPTEYLIPRETDFLSYNVYLHRGADLRAYLSRLQNLAEERPLLLGEFGMDTIRHSEEEQSNLLSLHWDEVFRGGLAGTILFSWTDEWFTDGIDVEDWAFGLVRKDRQPKLAYQALARQTISPQDALVEKFPLSRTPKVSVVVCSYNGGATLRGCLAALQKMNYPDFEVILVDDGSKDNTQSIAAEFPLVKNILQPNRGLSVARNVGLYAATGEIIAYTDSDCMPDSDWLYFLVATLLQGSFAAVGGPNLHPPAQNSVAAAVAACPGAPTHVLLTDTEAEHIPGCNMAYWRSALEGWEGLTVSFEQLGMMWIFVGVCCSRGIGSVLVLVRWSGITVALRCRLTFGSRRGTGRRRRCYDLNICSISIPKGRPDGRGSFMGFRDLSEFSIARLFITGCLEPDFSSVCIRSLPRPGRS